MNLTWHIAKKDLLRMALPAALWGVLVLGGAMWMRSISVPATAASDGLLQTWFDTHAGFAMVLGLLQGMIAYVLIGALVLEDVVVGSTAFWLTRPISGAQLIGAKAIVALLWFVVVPIVGLIPIWISAHYSVVESLHGAFQFALLHIAALCGGFFVASLTANIGQYFLATLILVVAALTGVFLGTSRPGPTAVVLNGTHGMLVLLTCGLAIVGFVTWQYAMRRTRLAWAVVVTALIAVVGAVRVHWGSGFGAWANQVAIEIAPDRVSGIEAIRRSGGDAQVLMRGSAIRAAEVAVIPIRARATLRSGDDVIARFDARLTNRWEETVAEQLLHGSNREPIWKIDGMWTDVRHGSLTLGPKLCDGTIILAKFRVRLLGELPLRAEAAARAGGPSVRIAAVGDTEDGQVVVAIEERSPENSLNPALLPHVDNDTPRSPITLYLALNRSKDRVERLSIRNRGTMQLNGIAVSAAEIVIAPPGRHAPADWDQGMTLAIVRLEPERYEQHPLVMDDVQLMEEATR